MAAIKSNPLGLLTSALLLTLLMGGAAAGDGVRQPVRAGAFYPSNPQELRGLIDRLAQSARRIAHTHIRNKACLTPLMSKAGCPPPRGKSIQLLLFIILSVG